MLFGKQILALSGREIGGSIIFKKKELPICGICKWAIKDSSGFPVLCTAGGYGSCIYNHNTRHCKKAFEKK